MLSDDALYFYEVLWKCLDFVCVEVLRPSQPNGVMSSAVSLPNHTFTGEKCLELFSNRAEQNDHRQISKGSNSQKYIDKSYGSCHWMSFGDAL